MANLAMTATVLEEGFKDFPGVSECVEFTGVATALVAGDTLTCTLPARYRGQSLSVAWLQVDQFTTSGAVAGAVTKVSVPVATFTYVQTTGVLVLTLGAIGIASTQTPCAKICMTPAST